MLIRELVNVTTSFSICLHWTDIKYTTELMANWAKLKKNFIVQNILINENKA